MPLLKASEALPERPVIITIFGDPGIGKTSLINTAYKPILIDADRGGDRAIMRQDMLIVRSWEDVIVEETTGLYKDYSTIGIDTPKAVLDDFLMAYVQKLDYKLKTNKLKAYGAIADEFKLFLSNRRSENADILIVCHAKREKDGDVVRTFPDVTGQSEALLIRISDQVGYYSMVNGKRTIKWEPTDNVLGKNVGKLPMTEVPNEADPRLKTFMADIFKQVKQSLARQSEAQEQAIKLMDEYTNAIEGITDVDALNAIVTPIQAMPKLQKDALNKLVKDKADKMGWVFKKETKGFVVPVTETFIEPAQHTLS